LEQKIRAELSRIEREEQVRVLYEFLDGEIGQIRKSLETLPRTQSPDWERLDEVFRGSLREAWGK
jgi:hypothetical protein